MKVLFYLLDGDTNASSYHRALQFFPFLRRHGIEPCASRPVPQHLYARLAEGDARPASVKLGYYALFLARRTLHVQYAQRADVVVVQRDLFPFGPALLESLLRRRNPRLVYDTDDATYLKPSFTPATVFQHLRRFDKVADVVRCARWVSVATEPIALWARRYNPRVTVVPMAVDLARYEAVRRPTGAGPSPLVIGWAGTAGGLGYLEALAPVLREIARQHAVVVRVISGGYRRVRLPGVPVDARPWRPDEHLADIASFDIGLVPLHDSPFEQAKFPFKLLQYLALGIPTVSARLGVAARVIRSAENGLLAGSPEEWHAALTHLITDARLRRRLAEAGRDTVASQ
ncbi:MAG: glycosyltransferase, partial [Chloroflexota bacterium]|nr:glycosyltransferase [Chloroflexota bacterium]